MGHNIVDVWHHPGQLNQAADGISHQFTDGEPQGAPSRKDGEGKGKDDDDDMYMETTQV